MEKYRAIPHGYMTVGVLAKRLGTSVRTLQYYDKQGLLSPSAESDGGRRLYTDKDMVRLHQILSMKYLGFSLDDIKHHLIVLDTPDEVAQALTEHAAAIREAISALTDSLTAIEALCAEVTQMQTVDFGKYADIIVNLQMRNEYYRVIKHFDDDTLDRIRRRFDKQSGQAMMDTITRLNDEAARLQAEGVPPDSERGQEFAQEYWDMISEFTKNDPTLFAKLLELPASLEGDQSMSSMSFIEPALGAYFERLGVNPFEAVAS